MKAALGTISHTLHNLAYVYAYIEDESMSSYLLETAVTINKALKDSSKEECEDLFEI